MQQPLLDTILLSRDDAMFTACKLRFAESRVGVTMARDAAGFKAALRERPAGVIILDAAGTLPILGLSPEEAVLKLSPLLASKLILVLAEPDTPPDRVVRLLELGARDVVLKPVKPRILAEQLKAMARASARGQKPDRKVLTSPTDLLVMDYPRRRCFVKEVNENLLATKRDIRFTKAEFQVLHLLLQKKGEVATYEDFRERIWPDAGSPREILHTLHQLVTNIRRKLAPCPVKIENLRAEGFRLA